MNISKICADAKAAIEYSSGTYFLFHIAPQVEDFCVDECFRLAQQYSSTPTPRPDMQSLELWKVMCCNACMNEFHRCLKRLQAA